MSCSGRSSGERVAENEMEIGVTFDAESCLSALTELLQSEFAKHSLAHEQAIELAAICFSKGLGLSDDEASALVRCYYRKAA